MGWGPSSAYGVWAIDVEWQRADAPLTMRMLKARGALPPTEITTGVQTGRTTWSACWDGDADEQMTVEVAFPPGTSQDVQLIWWYPAPKNAPNPQP